MPVIETQELTKLFDDTAVSVRAVDAVNLAVEEGEFTAIVGPSGSGKTTLLNLLGGLDRPTSGKVMIAGADIHALSDSALTRFRLTHIGFVFQAYNLLPVLTAFENAEFTMLLQGRSVRERHERVAGLLARVGLGERLGSRPRELSGGQQQRVAVVRALAPRPRFILADEPTANLDSTATRELLDIMAQLNREEGTTFVFATHDQRVIDRARRVVSLKDGHIDRDEVREAPRTRRT
jgi:putative ABC transport system ATP-binding protein